MQSRYTIVVGVSFERSSDAAIGSALQALQTGQVGVLQLMHVIAPCEPRCCDHCCCRKLEPEVLSLAPSALRERVAHVARSLDIKYRAEQVATHAMVGDLAESLLQACARFDADLLIVCAGDGSPTHHGSAVRALMQRAFCPVFVVRSGEQDGHAGGASSAPYPSRAP